MPSAMLISSIGQPSRKARQMASRRRCSVTSPRWRRRRWRSRTAVMASRNDGSLMVTVIILQEGERAAERGDPPRVLPPERDAALGVGPPERDRDVSRGPGAGAERSPPGGQRHLAGALCEPV